MNKMENNLEPLGKKERKALRREERLAERGAEVRRHRFSRFAKRGGWVMGVTVIVGLLGWYIATRPPIPEGDIISRNGIHWHPELAISIGGKRQDISPGIGLGAVHNPVHTHDPDNVIHLEFQGLVRKDDIKLARFFDVWGETFNQGQILEYKNGAGGMVSMLVNGQSNDRFEQYAMQDKDKIEIKYEK